MELNITLAEALERASEGLRKKMLHSVELLQKAKKIALNYDAENGYYLAFSGGKDSQALFHMTQLAGVKFRGHMNLTSVDPPEVIRFVKKNYPEVELIKPDNPFSSTLLRSRFCQQCVCDGVARNTRKRQVRARSR